MSAPYHRVLLKLSGEAFGGGSIGVDPDVIARVAGEIADIVARARAAALGQRVDHPVVASVG